jgi:deazaflavin-dependent oxidoreductase (nitroreductase family)
MQDWNKQIIDEFHSKEGKVGGMFEGVPILLLHNTGRKSGKTYVNPLAYQKLDDGKVAVFGSKGGSPTHPDWFHNVQANPKVKVEVGTEEFDATARVAEGDERERIWTKQKKEFSGFADYETRTTRVIPVIILEPVS